MDGQLYRGAAGAAGEIAYLPVGPGDPHDPAYRRRGQLEETASAAAVTRIARAHGLRPPSAKNVFAAARRGDPAAAEVVDLIAGRIALAIAAVVPVLDPALVILGGGIAGNGGRPAVRADRARSFTGSRRFGRDLAVSALGDEVVLHGAVATALAAAQETLFDRVRDTQPREGVG